jgi:hypothetical protein
MKTDQLPPVRVEPAMRREIESVLREGETLSEFVKNSTLQAARRRKAQQEFLARGRASLEEARRSGELYPLEETLDAIQARLKQRLEKHVRKARQAASEPAAVKAAPSKRAAAKRTPTKRARSGR